MPRRKVVKRGKKRKGGNPATIGTIWNAIPADLKRQAAKELAKQITLKVVAPTAAAIGASKLYRKIKSR